MRIIPLNGAIVCTDDVDIYGVFRLDIDKTETTIEIYGFGNVLLGRIKYDCSNGPIEYIDYYENGNIKEFADTIVNSNGELVI